MSGFNFLKPPASSAAPTGGLFSSTPASTSGGLFGNTGGQQQQSGGLFGNTNTSSQQQSGGLFGNTTGQSQSGGLFGGGGNQQQPQQQTGGLFGNTQSQSQSQAQPSGLFGGLGNTQQQQQQQQQKPNLLNLNLNPTHSTQRSSNPQIDIEHLRPTTKFDHLTPALQAEIEALDNHILGQINMCNQLSNALPGIVDSGKEVPQDYSYVKEKFDELELALENDAADIVDLRDKVVKKDAAEGRLCWKSVDRLRMPAQYQSHHPHDGRAVTETVYGGSGLSGWWNNPIMSTRTRRGPGRAVVAIDTEEEIDIAPGTLVDMLNGHAEEMKRALTANKDTLDEIEGFVSNVESKIFQKELELQDGPPSVGGGVGSEKERQIRMLRYVFGEVERSLYEVAERVGESRDGLMELGEKSFAARSAF